MTAAVQQFVWEITEDRETAKEIDTLMQKL